MNWKGQSMTHFTMSMPELEAALEAAMNLSRTIRQSSGTESKDYLRAWRVVEEVQAEILMRCSQYMCAI
jgi:hypothetical protein